MQYHHHHYATYHQFDLLTRTKMLLLYFVGVRLSPPQIAEVHVRY